MISITVCEKVLTFTLPYSALLYFTLRYIKQNKEHYYTYIYICI